jgi:hypothetical protein
MKENIALTLLLHVTLLFVEGHRDFCCDFVLRPGDETRTPRTKSFSPHLPAQQPRCCCIPRTSRTSCSEQEINVSTKPESYMFQPI